MNGKHTYRRWRHGPRGIVRIRASVSALFARRVPAIALCVALTVVFGSPISRAAGGSPSPDPTPRNGPSPGAPGPDPSPQAASGSGSGSSTSPASQQPVSSSSASGSSSSSGGTPQATSAAPSATGSGVALGSPSGSSIGSSTPQKSVPTAPVRPLTRLPTPAKRAHRIKPGSRATGAAAASSELPVSLAGSLARPSPQGNGVLLLLAALALATVALAGGSLLRLLRRMGEE